MKNAIRYFQKILGFTHSGTSVVGKYARKVFSRRETRRAGGTVLIALAAAVILIHSFANIGGNITLAANTPKPVIDATTLQSIQSPVKFFYESRGFSWYHSGADLVAPTGTPVYPIMPGKVKESNAWHFGFGKHVIIEHESGYQSTYAHLSKIEVKPGQEVALATKLGEVGSTGLSTGPHLHLEVVYNSVPINPAEIVPGVH